MLLETHSMGVFVHVDDVFSGHYLTDGRMALLLATLLCRSHYAEPKWVPLLIDHVDESSFLD